MNEFNEFLKCIYNAVYILSQCFKSAEIRFIEILSITAQHNSKTYLSLFVITNLQISTEYFLCSFWVP